MTQLTFYPLGDADTSLIQLRDGRRMLVDYANKWTGQPEDKRCNLPKLLKEDLTSAGIRDYAVVAFTHLDADHCQGAADFFYLNHAAKYQGLDRAKIETLWVPAIALTEANLDGDARIIRQEARCRMIEGKGIVVFSRPERLKDWFDANGISMESRRHCFIDAGKLAPGFSLIGDHVEFFVHSPHATRTNGQDLEDRNGDSIVFQARFEEGGTHTDVLFTGDITHEVIADIVRITRWHGREDRLHWNIYHLPHHCSYLSLGPDKGEEKTKPVPEVRWLCEQQGEPLGYVISPSKPIPFDDADKLPPHRQAANYYMSDVLQIPGRFLVTMAEPSTISPKPIVITINGDGAVKNPQGFGGSAAAASVVAPRAG